MAFWLHVNQAGRAGSSHQGTHGCLSHGIASGCLRLWLGECKRCAFCVITQDSHIQKCKFHHNLTSTKFSSNVSKNTDPRITSSSPLVVHSRTFVNSRIVQKIKSKVVQGHKNVIKCVDNSKTCLTVVNQNDSSVPLNNRFLVFSDMSESEIDNKVMEKCKSSIKVNRDKPHKRVNLQNCVLGGHSQNHINQ